MREILFRGKRASGNGWVDGCLIIKDGNAFIIQNDSDYWHPVIPETVGQYTGLKDKNGVKIFEGDVISAWSQGWNAVGEVKHRIDGLWFMYPAYQHKIMWGLCPNHEGKTSVEVIGNIHDNPELVNDK